MELIKQEVLCPKELFEVKVAIVELMKDVMAKKELNLIIGENLPLLMQAFQGFESMGEEVKSEHAPMVASLLAGEIAGILLAKKSEVAPQLPQEVPPAPQA